MRIKTKISGPIFLLVALLMGVLALAGYQYLAHALKLSVARQHAAMLRMASRYIDDELLHSRQMLELLVKGIDPARMRDRHAMQRELQQMQIARTFFNGGLEIFDDHRRSVATSLAAQSSPTGRGNGYAALALATGKSSISPPYLAETAPHRPIISLWIPILRPDGSVAGLLAGHHDLTRDNETDRALHTVGQRGRLLVLERNRTIIWHPAPSRVMAHLAPGEDPGIDDALQRNRLSEGEVRDANGETWVTTATPLTNADWIVAIQHPESESYQPLIDARLFFLGALIALLLLTQIALRRLIRHITQPLSLLVDHIRSLPQKNGAERWLTLDTGDELEHLASTVNSMVEEMDKRQEALKENQELYRIIAEFTSEIAIVCNPDGSLRYISSNCQGVTGYADREFLDAPELLSNIIPPEDRDMWQQRNLCAREGKPAAPVELRLITRQGDARWFKYTCRAVNGADGEYLGLRGSFRDITQDRVLEGMLETERRFAENLLENTSTPLFVIDADHRIIVWNRAIAEMTGMPANEMLGTQRQWQPFYPENRPTLCDVVLSGDVSRIGEFYPTYSSDVVMKGIIRAEGWYRNLNGRDRYLCFDAAPVTRDGKVVAVVETLYDITERARAEESLRLFSQGVEQSASTIVITDADGVIQYVNRKFCEVSGYSKEEALGRKPSILKSGRLPDQEYRELWETITAGREWHGEFYNRRKDGTFYWESALISPICDQYGKVTHYLGVKEEITARKDAERQLLKNQAELVLKHEQLSELFRQVEKGKREWEQTMDCVDDLVAMVDDQGKVRRCNRAFKLLTGSSYSRLVSVNWRELLSGAGMNLEPLETGHSELYHEASGRWLTLTTYPYGDQGWQVIMLHDLTEIKQVSEELVAAYQELKATHSQLLQQEKMASIGQLAAGVAHEINNPMGFISSNLGTMVKYLERLEGFLEIQSNSIAGVAPEPVRQGIEQARKKFKVDYILGDAKCLLAESQDGAERVRTIVQNLKSFSRIDDAQATCVDLNECLESTVTIAWNELKYKTTLVRDYGELPQVKCLPQQLNQVFLNLLVNAAHAIEKQGEITIRTRRAGDEVLIAFSDTGSGIPDEIKSRIFEPFFTTKEVGQGTGLGLSISYDIIKKHNGSIEVESSVGIGTTFTIRLPIEGVTSDD
ncbi:PAS domain S-box protein [Geomonas propionica]|uniref:histidine kinase n=1 Tax=Geomonas propionica TaxID=2798582 RepID=A0ABS0YVL7_9BACT|nr:PAS domain S-box protein [Geomonas propionica]MBJ6802015.1 PAS domain S-box protein [Geomonas propionica]